MSATYSLSEVAEEMRLYEQMKDPVRWLTKEIKAGRVQARRIGRSWRMSRAQIEAVTTTQQVVVQPADEAPRFGLSVASAARRLAS